MERMDRQGKMDSGSWSFGDRDSQIRGRTVAVIRVVVMQYKRITFVNKCTIDWVREQRTIQARCTVSFIEDRERTIAKQDKPLTYGSTK